MTVEFMTVNFDKNSFPKPKNKYFQSDKLQEKAETERKYSYGKSKQ